MIANGRSEYRWLVMAAASGNVHDKFGCKQLRYRILCKWMCYLTVYEESNTIRSPILEHGQKILQLKSDLKGPGGGVWTEHRWWEHGWITTPTALLYSTESKLKTRNYWLLWYSYVWWHACSERMRRQHPSVLACSEQSKYVSTASLTSNILDAEFAADWGVLTYTTSGQWGSRGTSSLWCQCWYEYCYWLGKL